MVWGPECPTIFGPWDTSTRELNNHTLGEIAFSATPANLSQMGHSSEHKTDLSRAHAEWNAFIEAVVADDPDGSKGVVEKIVGVVGELRYEQIMLGSVPSWPEGIEILRALGQAANAPTSNTMQRVEDMDPIYQKLVFHAAFQTDAERKSLIRAFNDFVRKHTGTTAGVAITVIAASGLLYWSGLQSGSPEANEAIQMVMDESSRAIAESTRLIGEAQAAETDGRETEARSLFAEALREAGRAVRLARGNADAAKAQSDAQFYLANFDWRWDNREDAITGFDRYAELTEALYRLDPFNPVYRAERAYGWFNQATLQVDYGATEDALEAIVRAQSELAAVATQSDAVSELDVANAIGWRADALLGLGRLNEALEQRRAQLAIYDRVEGGGVIRFNAIRETGWLLIYLGRVIEARELTAGPLAEAEALVDQYPESRRVQLVYQHLLRQRAYLELFEEDWGSSQLIASYAGRQHNEASAPSLTGRPDNEVVTFNVLNSQIAFRSGRWDTAIRLANNTIYFFDGMGVPDADAGRFVGEAYEVAGDSHAALGNQGLADETYRAGLAALDEMPPHALNAAVRSRLLDRLGMSQDAQSVRADLVAAGFNAPFDAAYWNSRPLTAQNLDGETDG